MTRSRVRFLLIYLLPSLHLCACLTIALARLESGWQYMMLIDVPMSVIIVAISYNFDHPLLLFGSLGTLWWYLLSRAADMIGTRVFATIRRHRPSRTESSFIDDKTTR